MGRLVRCKEVPALDRLAFHNQTASPVDFGLGIIDTTDFWRDFMVAAQSAGEADSSEVAYMFLKNMLGTLESLYPDTDSNPPKRVHEQSDNPEFHRRNFFGMYASALLFRHIVETDALFKDCELLANDDAFFDYNVGGDGMPSEPILHVNMRAIGNLLPLMLTEEEWFEDPERNLVVRRRPRSEMSTGARDQAASLGLAVPAETEAISPFVRML